MTKDVDKLIEEKLGEFLVTGYGEDDPYWDLFKINRQVNDAVVDAVKYGFREGMKQNRTVKDWAEDSATIRFLRHREEVLLHALYDVTQKGVEVSDIKKQAAIAIDEWAAIKL